MRLVLTGPQLFLRYAWPCAEDKLLAEQITPADFSRLKKSIEDGAEPKTSLLRRCFRNAVASLEKYSVAMKKEAWNHSTVSRFWRHHHGHEGDCAVACGVVCNCCVEGNDAFQVLVRSNIITALNLYRLPLDTGDEVYIHRRVITEKVD
jgi:hypothetical protein